MPYDPAKNHAAFGALQDLVDVAGSSQLTSLNEELDEYKVWQIQRILFVAREASRRAKLARGTKANLNTLNNLTNMAQNIAQELRNYLSNRNVGHIDNAWNNTDQSLAIFVEQLPKGPAAAEDKTELDALRGQIQSVIADIGSRRDELVSQLDGVSAKVTEQDQLIATSSSAINESVESIESALADIETRFETIREKFEASNSTTLTEGEKKISDALAALKRRGDEKIAELEKKKGEASAIVQSVGDILTTGTYRDTAEKESKLANTYRLVTIGLFSIGILIVVSNYIIHAIASYNGQNFVESPWFLLSRFATAVAVALPALYTARESARHRSNADKARQRELELTTLGPFIELLPAAKKNEIRDRLTDRYFNGEVEPHEVHPPLDLDQLSKLLESAAKLNPKTGV